MGWIMLFIISTTPYSLVFETKEQCMTFGQAVADKYELKKVICMKTFDI